MATEADIEIQRDLNRQYEELTAKAKRFICAECGGDLVVRLSPIYGICQLWCGQNHSHTGFKILVERGDMVTESRALVTRSADPFSLMDYLDDQQVVAEIKGVVLAEWVYDIKMGGKNVIGLSKAGIDACAGELARKRGEVLREMDFQLIQNPDDVIATVKAGRYAVSADGKEALLDVVFGVKRQSRKQEVHDKDAQGNRLETTHLEDDQFVIEKALMKAARNAKKRLIPMEIQQVIISQARAGGKVKNINDNGGGNTPTDPDAPICPTHNKAMTQGQYGWYCKSKVGDGWCKYKPPTEKAPAPAVDAKPAPASTPPPADDGHPPTAEEQAAGEQMMNGGAAKSNVDPRVDITPTKHLNPDGTPNIQKCSREMVDRVSRAMTAAGYLPADRPKLWPSEWFKKNFPGYGENFTGISDLTEHDAERMEKAMQAIAGGKAAKGKKESQQ